jgi:hypothetical protein
VGDEWPFVQRSQIHGIAPKLVVEIHGDSFGIDILQVERLFEIVIGYVFITAHISVLRLGATQIASVMQDRDLTSVDDNLIAVVPIAIRTKNFAFSLHKIVQPVRGFFKTLRLCV